MTCGRATIGKPPSSGGSPPGGRTVSISAVRLSEHGSAAMSTAATAVDRRHDTDDAEAAALGGILAGAPIPDGLQASHFYRREYGLIYGACLAVAVAGEPVNELTVTHQLRDNGNLEAVGGAMAVSALTNSPDVINVNYYADRVVEAWTQREAAKLVARIQHGEDLEVVLPELMALHRSEDTENIAGKQSWPVLAPEAHHGLAGDIVAAIEPHTEADPIAILAQFLAFFGSCAGRTPYFTVEADRHGLNESMVLVGRTSRARKGTSLGHVRRLFAEADPAWCGNCIVSGLSSGEGLIWAVRDPIIEMKTPKGGGPPQGVVVDEGVTDKRLLVVESEYSSPLKMMARRGNTLSPVIRDAWDGRSLRSLVKHSPARSTDPHITILGHITETELRSLLTETDAANGYGNRVMWLCVRRSKELPEGGTLDPKALSSFIRNLRLALDHARKVGEIKRDPQARALWARVYHDLSTDHPGLLGAMIARAEAHVTRLSVLYATLDRSPTVTIDHLSASLALWQFAEDSARYIFGETLGDPVADRLLELLTDKPDGTTQTAVHRALGNHVSAGRLNACLKQLESLGRVIQEQRKTEGRTAVVWRLARG